jgi:hypothetical protein
VQGGFVAYFFVLYSTGHNGKPVFKVSQNITIMVSFAFYVQFSQFVPRRQFVTPPSACSVPSILHALRYRVGTRHAKGVLPTRLAATLPMEGKTKTWWFHRRCIYRHGEIRLVLPPPLEGWGEACRDGGLDIRGK